MMIRNRIMSILCLSVLTYASVACTKEPDQQTQEFWQKMVGLTMATCDIYPKIENLETCVDTVTRGILEGREHPKEEVTLVIAELEKQIREQSTPPLSPSGALSHINLAQKILGAASYSCLMIEPKILDSKKCADVTYHSILSSRDPHSTYFNKEEIEEFRMNSSGRLEGIGANVGWTEEKSVGIVSVMEGSPAEKAGIVDGDRIITIVNGDERIATSTFPNLESAIKKMRGKPGTLVTFEVLRDEVSTPLTIAVKRASVDIPMVKWEILTLPSDSKVKYAYITIKQFGDVVSVKIADAVRAVLIQEPNVAGIIFNVRGDPGGLLYETQIAANFFVNSTEPLVSIRDNAGIHALTTPKRDSKIPSGDITHGLPIGVFVDRGSASAAEIFPGILKQRRRAVIIGKGTWQKGTVQTFEKFDAESATKSTTSEYLIGSPENWVAVQCRGVTPHIPYEAPTALKVKKEMHECDLPGAVVSGGSSSHPDKVEEPLEETNPALYQTGLRMLEAVKALDTKEFAKLQERRKQLKIALPKEPEEEKKK